MHVNREEDPRARAGAGSARLRRSGPPAQGAAAALGDAGSWPGESWESSEKVMAWAMTMSYNL